MSFFNMIRSKTLAKIFISITLAILLIVIIFSRVMYNAFQEIGLRMAFDYNKKIVSHISYNIDYMNQTVRNFMKTQFVDPDVGAMMYRKTEDPFFTQRFINNFVKVISSNEMIHSALFYNRSLNQLFSSYGTGFISLDHQIMDIIKGNNPIPLLLPIPRLLPNEHFNTEDEVFTYFQYDNPNANGAIDGAPERIQVFSWVFNGRGTGLWMRATYWIVPWPKSWLTSLQVRMSSCISWFAARHSVHRGDISV